MDLLWVGLGGCLGAMARYGLSLWIVDHFGTGFRLPTLVINVSGSLAIGVLLVLMTERLGMDPAWRLFLVVGFLSGYTTSSSYTFKAWALVLAGEWPKAITYVLASKCLGLVAVVLGVTLARLFQ
jgi:CrcB protein